MKYYLTKQSTIYYQDRRILLCVDETNNRYHYLWCNDPNMNMSKKYYNIKNINKYHDIIKIYNTIEELIMDYPEIMVT